VVVRLDCTATFCDALQRTAAHCSTDLRRPSLDCYQCSGLTSCCITLQHTATHCTTLQHTATLGGTAINVGSLSIIAGYHHTHRSVCPLQGSYTGVSPTSAAGTYIHTHIYIYCLSSWHHHMQRSVCPLQGSYTLTRGSPLHQT